MSLEIYHWYICVYFQSYCQWRGARNDLCTYEIYKYKYIIVSYFRGALNDFARGMAWMIPRALLQKSESCR